VCDVLDSRLGRGAPGLGLRIKIGAPHTGLPLPFMQLKIALGLLQLQTDYRQLATKSSGHRYGQ